MMRGHAYALCSRGGSPALQPLGDTNRCQVESIGPTVSSARGIQGDSVRATLSQKKETLALSPLGPSPTVAGGHFHPGHVGGPAVNHTARPSSFTEAQSLEAPSPPRPDVLDAQVKDLRNKTKIIQEGNISWGVVTQDKGRGGSRRRRSHLHPHTGCWCLGACDAPQVLGSWK